MKYIEGQYRDQITFLPDCIDDLIGQDNPVRVIDCFVENLDMEELGFQREYLILPGDPATIPEIYLSYISMAI